MSRWVTLRVCRLCADFGVIVVAKLHDPAAHPELRGFEEEMYPVEVHS